MGASQSIKKSSKSNPIKGDGQSSTRKFQSYHLPFHKEKGEKGFAKFKRSILGKKKPKTEPYQHTLSTLTSTSLQNLPDHEHSPSLDSRGQSTNGTQFYTWGPRKHTQRPRCPSPPKEEENKDTEIQFQEVDLNSGDRNGVKNDDLMCSSKIVTDTYSAVLKKKDDINIAETQRKESSSSSSGEKSANSVFEDASDELPQAVQQALDETSKDNEELSKMTEAPCEMQLETTVEKDNSEVPTSSTLTSTTDTIENNKQYSIAQRQDSDSSSERSGSVGEDGAPCYSSASTGVISRNSSGDVPWEDVDDGITTEDVHHSTQIQLQCEQVESSNQFLVRKELETITTNTLEEVKASSTSECDIKPASEANEDKDVKEDSAIPKPKDVGQLSLIEVPDQSEVNTNDGSKNTEQRNELTDVDRAVTATSSTITDPEQALDGHLHPLAIAQESNQTVEMEPPNNSNIASSIKVSDIIEFSEESAEQDQQKEPSNGSSALEPTNQHNKQPNAKEEALTTSTSGLPLKKSSSTSSEEKVSRNASSDSSSDIDDDVWDDDTRNPKSPEAIKTKLVLDLLKTLEVDMGDFQTFLEIAAPFDDKYQLLPLQEFLETNLEGGFSIDDLGRCLRILAKYGLTLLKPDIEDAAPHWRKVVLPSDVRVKHWLCVEGAKEILCVFGYEDRDEYLEYVREGEQDIECIAAWVIEMLLAAHEIQAYCLGIHPNPVCFQFHTSDDNDEITNTEHPIDNTHRLKDIPEAPQERANGQQKADDDIDDDDEQQQMEPSAHKMGDCEKADTPLPSTNCETSPSESGTPGHTQGDNKEEDKSEKVDPLEEIMFGRRPVMPWPVDKTDHSTSQIQNGGRCHMCGSSTPAVKCEKCSNLIFCMSCDGMYHRHPKRQDHLRKLVDFAPPPPPPRPPPKITDPDKIPVPPPRRRKSQRSIPGSPVFGRRQVEEKPELPKKQFPLRFGSLRRLIPKSNNKNSPAVIAAPQPVSPFFASSGYPDHPAAHSNLMNDYRPQNDVSYMDEKYGVGPWPTELHRLSGGSQRRPTPTHLGPAGYYEAGSTIADPSSSDAEDEISRACSIGRGSGGSTGRSLVRDDEWVQPGSPFVPHYGGGMSSRSMASLDHLASYGEPNMGYSTLGRRNPMMNNTLERRMPSYTVNRSPSLRLQQQQHHSTSVNDLTNPMMPFVGYPLPHVQSMADLQRQEMEGIPIAPPCGCRPHWIGPDAFGQWHAPVRCLVHSSASGAYHGNTFLKQQQAHQQSMVSGFPTPVYPQVIPGHHRPSPVYPRPSPTPPPPPRPSVQASPPVISNDSRALTKEPTSSPPTSIRSNSSKRRSKPQSNNVSSRGFRPHSRRNRPEETTSSEGDYFSAGASDEENGDDPRMSRSKARNRGHRIKDGSWECEHCTFINRPDTRICNMCCKTTGRTTDTEKRRTKSRSSPLANGSQQISVSPGSPPTMHQSSSARILDSSTAIERQSKDDGEYEDLENKTDLENDKFLARKLESSVKLNGHHKEVKASRAGNDLQMGNVEIQTTIREEIPDMRHSSIVDSRIPHERKVMDAALDPMEDEDRIQNTSVQADTQTYATVFKTKPSTITKEASTGTKSVTESKGTSPPPQSISTQTPHSESWIPPDHSPPVYPKASMGRTSSRMSLAGDSTDFGGPYRPGPLGPLKRAASLHFTGTGITDTPWGVASMARSGSRASITSDHPYGRSTSPLFRDASPPRNFSTRRESSIDPRGSYSGYSAFSRIGQQEEYGYGARNSSHKDYYLNLEELVQRRRQETMRTQGLELVKMLREAEQHNFTADDLHVAMNHCGSQNPIQWLQDNWKNMVDTVVTLATNFGHDKKENDIGIISGTEAKDALRLHKGNIWAAVTECIEQRQKKFTEIQNRGNYSREEVVAALTANQGSLEAAVNDLNKSSLKPFLMRIWGPPAGADNEAGSTWPRIPKYDNRDTSSAFFPVKKQSNNRDVPNGANEYRPYRVQNDTFSQRDVINDYLNPDSSSDLSDEEYLGQANEERGNIMEGCFHVLDDANNIPYSSPQYSDVTEQRDDVFYDATPGTPSDNLEEVANSVDQLPTEAVEVMPFEPLPTLPTLKNSDVVGVETAVVSPFPDKQLTVSKHEVVQMEVASTESSEPLSFHPQQQSSDHMMKDDCLNIPPALEVSSNQSKDENGSMGEVTTDAEPHTEPQTANEQVTIPVYNKDEDNRRFKNTSPPPAVLQSVSTNNTEELSQNTELTVVETVAPTETKSPDMNVPFAPVKPDPCVEVKSIDPQIKCETSSATVKSEIEKIIQPEVSQESLLESSNCSDVSETSKECLITKTSNEVPVSQQSNKMKKSPKNVDVNYNLKIISPLDEGDYGRRVRQLLAEGVLPTYEKAEIAVHLIDLRFDENEAFYAARECSDLSMAVSYLQQDCELCTGKFPMGKMISMLNCTHRCCRNCAKEYYTLKLKERNIMEAVCPFCNEPNLNDDDVATDYFNNLDIMLKNLVDPEIHELFQCKLRDRALMNDPNFRWCNKCGSGFIAELNHRRLVCPDCRDVTCAQCRKPWEKQHDGISCEKFAAWKEANDPEAQLAGLEKYLAENGIDCPKCKFRYALAKGGCMHFTCSQCKFEFCSGCGRPFRMSNKCGMSLRCEKLGLHAHHPRNCLFYLRDKEPKELQKLLDDHNITYDNGSDKEYPRHCPVIEQKELPDGNEDSVCGREVEIGHPGLCRLHYVEYLVSLVNKNSLDPVTIMDIGGLQQQLKRKEFQVPMQKETDNDDCYRETLVQMIQLHIPLEHS